jgi:cell division protein FtsB
MAAPARAAIFLLGCILSFSLGHGQAVLAPNCAGPALNSSLTWIGDCAAMVVRRRLRAILYPLLLYCVSGAIGGYFVWHAVNGERGLKTKQDYGRQIAALQSELIDLKDQRQLWQHKVDLLRGETIDQDLLQEEAEAQLGRVGKNDLVVIFDHASR